MSVDIEAATENATIIEVATRIVLGIFNGMPVIDEKGHPIGQITTIDILKAIQRGEDINNSIVKEIMIPNPLTIDEATDIAKIIDIMDKYGVMMVPVVEKDGRLIGICSRADILKGILDEKFVTIGKKRIATTTIGEA